MLGRYVLASSDLSRITLALLTTLFLYFAWMDLVLYYRIQNLQPLHLVTLPSLNGSLFPPDTQSAGSPGPSSISQQPNGFKSTTDHKQEESFFSPFNGLSIKLMMMDHLNHYIETPLCLAISKGLQLGTKLLWISPNLMSFIGMVLAVLAGRCMSWDGRGWHLLAVVLMLFRGLMDGLDGLVARERKGIVQHVSLYHTTGYLVDAVADTVGYTAFLLGCFVYLKRNIPKQYQPLPVVYQGDEKPKKKLEPLGSISCNGTQWTSQRIFLVLFCVGLQDGLAAVLWDHYCNAYYVLLETPRASGSQAIVQSEVLKSTLMWLVIWLWRISNAHAILNWVLVSILVNKLWEYLIFIQYIGFAEIVTLFLFTEIHYRDVSAYVNMVP